MSRVVHCKKANFDVYIGRKHSDFPEGSPYFNPFKIGIDGTRAEVIEKYERYLRSSPELLERLLSLDGKILGCWCKPKQCHGDVILKIINELKVEKRFIIF